jgi:hypothetical protein
MGLLTLTTLPVWPAPVRRAKYISLVLVLMPKSKLDALLSGAAPPEKGFQWPIMGASGPPTPVSAPLDSCQFA